ncbi:glycine/betaine ABC transporter substrate-binding protein [Haloprofundus marisrubri]|uniref:Glycine/betaine ABC transporter substrate-binding protein n=2 Tax=Haloprofundus marisrubri TaxID=1514971 RepID=A0A0W1RDJ9_9EURY|nr:glycine/betaine ABC transporter substrate-binding protein [Haloprofundus marisrubri]
MGVLGGSSSEIQVSSKRFAEQKILGYTAIEALKQNSELNPVDETGLGGSMQNFKALSSGEVDAYWEYTGTAWYTEPPKHEKTIDDPKKLYQKVKQEFKQQHGLIFLNRAPFNNTFVLMANPDWVEETGVESISDLAEYINSGNTDFRMAFTAEFLGRADGWKGVAKTYNFEKALEKLKPNIKQVGIGLTYQIVGKGDADVGLGFNTNPNIPKYDLVVLQDDKSHFPVYNPAPLVSQKVLDENPAVKQTLNPIGPKIGTDQIRKLNKNVSIDNMEPRKVAQNFLKEEGLI